MADIVVAYYALSDFPLGVVALGFESLRGRWFGGSTWYLGGMWPMVMGWLEAVAPPGVVTELVDEPILVFCPCCAVLIYIRGRAVVDRIPAECPPG